MCMNELEMGDLVPKLCHLPQVTLSFYSSYLLRKKKCGFLIILVIRALSPSLALL